MPMINGEGDFEWDFGDNILEISLKVGIPPHANVGHLDDFIARIRELAHEMEFGILGDSWKMESDIDSDEVR
jgi:hypothetical protein